MHLGLMDAALRASGAIAADGRPVPPPGPRSAEPEFPEIPPVAPRYDAVAPSLEPTNAVESPERDRVGALTS